MCFSLCFLFSSESCLSFPVGSYCRCCQCVLSMVPCWLAGNVGSLLVRREGVQSQGEAQAGSSLLSQQEAEANLRKAKQGYKQRCEDHDKARLQVAKAEEEQQGTGPGAGTAASKALDKRRRLEEEAKNKVH
jgi:hypothetical protein